MHFIPDDDGGLTEGLLPGAAAEMDAGRLPEAMPLHGEQQQEQQQPVSFGDLTARAQQAHATLHDRMTNILHRLTEREQRLETKSAIEFFQSVERQPQNRQQIKGLCIACGKLVTSTGSSRLVKHILQCPLMPTEVSLAFKLIKNESDNKTCGKRDAELRAVEEAEIFAKKHAASRAALKQGGIKASMQAAEAAWADKCIAEFFYANGIAFSAASPEPGGLYKRMITAIKAAPAGYKPPN